jgi:hypothetical protein
MNAPRAIATEVKNASYTLMDAQFENHPLAMWSDNSIMTPARETLDNLLDTPKYADVRDTVRASKPYADLLTADKLGVGIDDDFLPWKRYLSPTDFIRLLLWDDGVYLDAVRTAGPILVNNHQSSILKTDWMMDKPVTLDELAAVQASVWTEFEWDKITVGQFAFLVARDRVMNYIRRGEPGFVRMLSIMDHLDDWRYSVVPHEEVACAVLFTQTFGHLSPHEYNNFVHFFASTGEMQPTLECIDTFSEFGYDKVAPYLRAGLTSRESIRNAIESDIDASLMSDLVG